MNSKLEKEKIRKQYFSNGGLIIISILGISGALTIYFSGIFNVKNINMLYECFSKNGIMIIFGTFFFLISLYCWRAFFLNIILNPKKEILYLYRNGKNEVYFINRRGKKYNYDFNNANIEDNSYYYVLKTHDYVYDIIGKANENWIPKEKKSYWLNLYSPVGNFEDLFLLPIVYVILLPGLLSFFMSKGWNKIYGLILSIVPFYIIIYDLIYKIKLKQANNKGINEKFFIKSYDILKKALLIIPVCIICIILTNIFINLSDFTSKLIFIPFLGCGLCTFGLVLSKITQNFQLEKLFYKGYIIICLIFWFGFLTFWTIETFKQEGSYLYFLFSIPFWIAGFFLLYKCIIKNK